MTNNCAVWWIEYNLKLSFNKNMERKKDKETGPTRDNHVLRIMYII